MLRHLTRLCGVLCLAAATVGAEDKPAGAGPATSAAAGIPAVPAEIWQLDGKVVQIYFDVDLVGAGKPSSLHTAYLASLLQQAGVKLMRIHSLDQKEDEKDQKTKPPDVVIFGDIIPLKLDPGEAADPFMAIKAKQRREEIQKYADARAKLERDAAAAGARVIRSTDAGGVAAALGLRGVTQAQITAALDARTRDMLTLQIPDLKADALSLADIIDFLRDVTGANIFVNWRALEAAGVDHNAPVTLNLEQVPLSEALDKLLTQAGGAAGAKQAKLGYTVQEGVIVISTDEDVKKQKR